MVHDVHSGHLCEPYFILGDNAFTTTRSLITPGDDDAFHFEQSSLRIDIECALVALGRQWGILSRPLEMSFNKRTALIGCCIPLHNYCIDVRIEMEDELQNGNGLIEVRPAI